MQASLAPTRGGPEFRVSEPRFPSTLAPKPDRPTGAAGDILQALERAAIEGRPAPTNEQLANFLFDRCPKRAGRMVSELARRGLIRVEAGPRRRRVQIMATGQWTSGPGPTARRIRSPGAAVASAQAVAAAASRKRDAAAAAFIDAPDAPLVPGLRGPFLARAATPAEPMDVTFTCWGQMVRLSVEDAERWKARLEAIIALAREPDRVPGAD